MARAAPRGECAGLGSQLIRKSADRIIERSKSKSGDYVLLSEHEGDYEGVGLTDPRDCEGG